MQVAPGPQGSQENIELVESAFAAWNRGDIETFADHVANDVAWVEVSGRPEGVANERLGRDRLRKSLETLFDAWESYRLELERVQDVGERVVAVVREVGRGRASGLEVAGRWGYLITVDNGQIVRIEAYRDAALALKMAGLGESGIGT
ncbi:MAG TPA: nuclear transport factor 2 family protein [Thermoleophilaceae bacterium]